MSSNDGTPAKESPGFRIRAKNVAAKAEDQAPDLVLFREEALAGFRALAGQGHRIENLYDEHLDL